MPTPTGCNSHTSLRPQSAIQDVAHNRHVRHASTVTDPIYSTPCAIADHDRNRQDALGQPDKHIRPMCQGRHTRAGRPYIWCGLSPNVHATDCHTSAAPTGCHCPNTSQHADHTQCRHNTFHIEIGTGTRNFCRADKLTRTGQHHTNATTQRNKHPLRHTATQTCAMPNHIHVASPKGVCNKAESTHTAKLPTHHTAMTPNGLTQPNSYRKHTTQDSKDNTNNSSHSPDANVTPQIRSGNLPQIDMLMLPSCL